MPSEPAWPRPVATSGDAWIWLTDLDAAADDDPGAPLALLSDDEQARAGRFVFDVHRNRFVACRAALRIRTLRDLDLVADRVFSAAERESLRGVAPDRKAEAFFAGWTRKEAYIKARGEGIGLLAAVEVALAPGDPPRLISVAGQPAEPDRWSIEAFAPLPGLAAAVCIEGRGRRWTPL